MKYDGYFKLEAGLIFDLLMKLVLIFDVEELEKLRFKKNDSRNFLWIIPGFFSGI